MKGNSFLVFLIFTYMGNYAQVANNGLPNIDQLNIQLKYESAEKPLADVFSNIEVIDARDDSSKIGYYSTGAEGKNWPKQYRILPSAKDGIDDWVTNYLAINTKNTFLHTTLLIVIKKFWLTTAAAPATIQNDKKVQPKQFGFDPGILTKLEFYLGKDSVFYPMYKFDSVFIYHLVLPQHSDYYITESLKQSLKKLFKINLVDVLNRGRKLSMREIESNNNKNTAIEILNTPRYKKGVYKNFTEFKTNSPSILEYEVRKGSMGDVLYVKENGAEYPFRNAWGFCDSTNLFINSGDKYSKLIRRQNSFYFTGFKGVERKANLNILTASLFNMATNTGSKHTQFIKVIKYYKVDIETGEAF